MNLIKTKLTQAKGYIQKAHQGLKTHLEANTVTDWYLGSQLPIRSGWYERNWENTLVDSRGIRFNWYNVENAQWDFTSTYCSLDLMYHVDFPSAYQDLPWRGVTLKGYILSFLRVI
jgi:hypothetical protein